MFNRELKCENCGNTKCPHKNNSEKSFDLKKISLCYLLNHVANSAAEAAKAQFEGRAIIMRNAGVYQ